MAPDPEAQTQRSAPGIPHGIIEVPAGADITLEGIRQLIQQASRDAHTACMNPPEGHVPWIPELGEVYTLIHQNEEKNALVFYTAPEAVWRQLGTPLPGEAVPEEEE